MSSTTTLAVRHVPWSDIWFDEVMAIEQSAYSHPWTRGNFKDSVAAGYHLELLLIQDPGHNHGQERVAGYLVAMEGVEEVHLLNITVAPAWQGQGLGTRLLQALCEWSRQRLAQWLWLEVRASNTRAQQVYQHFGFKRVGERKHYYPLSPGQREDAVVMSLLLRAPRQASGSTA
jgi:ribosomal-protein-alanine N-acetyltransferase